MRFIADHTAALVLIEVFRVVLRVRGATVTARRAGFRAGTDPRAYHTISSVSSHAARTIIVWLSSHIDIGTARLATTTASNQILGIAR